MPAVAVMLRPPRSMAGDASLLVLATVFGLLGAWQVQRAGWKAGVLADIARAERAPPLTLGDDAAPLTMVRLTGALRPGSPLRLGAEARQRGEEVVMGSDVVRVLIRPGQRPVLVDLGWAPDGDVPSPDGVQVLAGHVQGAQGPGLFSAVPDLSRRWFPHVDPGAMGTALGHPDVLPFIVVVHGEPGDRAGPVPAGSIPRPADNHISYAITWFGLAACPIALLLKARVG